jgi:hypothetical protein
VTKNGSLKKKVEISTNNILQQLDRKHKLKLTQTCSTFARHRNPFVNLLYRIEESLTFGKPFFIFSLNQIEFGKGTIADSRIRFISAIFDPLIIFLAKMKQTGVTIYGQNLIERIRYQATILEKIRIAIAPLWILLMSLLSFAVDDRFALRHSVKATLWACEDSLFALNRSLSTAENEANMIVGIFDERIHTNHLRLTLMLKRKTDDLVLSKSFAARYIVDTIFFILHLYYKTILESRKRPIN